MRYSHDICAGIYAEGGYNMKLRTAFKVQQQQQATSARGGRGAESGCTVDCVFLLQTVHESERESAQHMQIVGYSTRRTENSSSRT